MLFSLFILHFFIIILFLMLLLKQWRYIFMEFIILFSCDHFSRAFFSFVSQVAIQCTECYMDGLRGVFYGAKDSFASRSTEKYVQARMDYGMNISDLSHLVGLFIIRSNASFTLLIRVMYQVKLVIIVAVSFRLILQHCQFYGVIDQFSLQNIIVSIRGN